MIHPERIRALNDAPQRPGKYVLYWMQQSQRAHWNHALEYAVLLANERGLPVVVAFGITADYPEANERHYAFMLEGLREVSDALRRRRIRFVARLQAPDEIAFDLARDAAVAVVDCGYLRIQKQWRTRFASRAPCRVEQVEGDVIVPVETASDREQYTAATLRPRIHRLLPDFLIPVEEAEVAKPADMVSLPGLDLSDIESLLTRLRLDRSVQPVTGFRGGYNEALRRLHSFLQDGIASYPQKHGNPASNCASSLSPFLHFGQISPLQVALEAKKSPHRAGREAFLEQLIVRRELSANFTHFHPAYDSFDCLPDWARKTLHDHEGDERPQLYSLEQLEQAETGDPYWNAAQREMLKTGMMHNYMRMYWGKKILEWSPNPAEAFRRALYLNNRYELDGRDANGFAGVAWCFGKHDRPWGERPVFGKVRYMNEAGLRRKFDMASYLERVPGRNLQ